MKTISEMLADASPRTNWVVAVRQRVTDAAGLACIAGLFIFANYLPDLLGITPAAIGG